MTLNMLKNFRERHPHLCDLLILAAVSALVIFPALGQNRHWASREIRHAEIICAMPSGIAAILGVLATYGVGLLLLDRYTALVGAFALLGMPGYSLMARQARPDMILCFSVIVSCLFLCMGMRKYRCIPRMLYFTLAGLLAGLGVVTQGPL